jgi:hypothetical protein
MSRRKTSGHSRTSLSGKYRVLRPRDAPDLVHQLLRVGVLGREPGWPSVDFRGSSRASRSHDAGTAGGRGGQGCRPAVLNGCKWPPAQLSHPPADHPAARACSVTTGRGSCGVAAPAEIPIPPSPTSLGKGHCCHSRDACLIVAPNAFAGQGHGVSNSPGANAHAKAVSSGATPQPQ